MEKQLNITLDSKTEILKSKTKTSVVQKEGKSLFDQLLSNTNKNVKLENKISTTVISHETNSKKTSSLLDKLILETNNKISNLTKNTTETSIKKTEISTRVINTEKSESHINEKKAKDTVVKVENLYNKTYVNKENKTEDQVDNLNKNNSSNNKDPLKENNLINKKIFEDKNTNINSNLTNKDASNSDDKELIPKDKLITKENISEKQDNSVLKNLKKIVKENTSINNTDKIIIKKENNTLEIQDTKDETKTNLNDKLSKKKSDEIKLNPTRILSPKINTQSDNKILNLNDSSKIILEKNSKTISKEIITEKNNITLEESKSIVKPLISSTHTMINKDEFTLVKKEENVINSKDILKKKSLNETVSISNKKDDVNIKNDLSINNKTNFTNDTLEIKKIDNTLDENVDSKRIKKVSLNKETKIVINENKNSIQNELLSTEDFSLSDTKTLSLFDNIKNNIINENKQNLENDNKNNSLNREKNKDKKVIDHSLNKVQDEKTEEKNKTLKTFISDNLLSEKKENVKIIQKESLFTNMYLSSQQNIASRHELEKISEIKNNLISQKNVNEVKIAAKELSLGHQETKVDHKNIENKYLSKEVILDKLAFSRNILRTNIENILGAVDSTVIQNELSEMPDVNVNASTLNLNNIQSTIIGAKQSLNAIMSDVAKKMYENYKPPVTALKIVLNPGSLGSISIIMKSDKEKGLSISMNMSNAATLDVMNENQNILRSALEKNFESIGEFSLDFNMQDQNSSKQQDQEKEKNKKTSTNELLENLSNNVSSDNLDSHQNYM